jgi:hypothetical protein
MSDPNESLWEKLGITFKVTPIPSQGRDQVELAIAHGDNQGIWQVECDTEDYSQVYICEYYDAETGMLRWYRECGDFDEKGWPHTVTFREFNKQGKLTKECNLAVISVEVNAEIDPNTFKFSVPLGYTMIDRRVSPPMIIDAMANDAFHLDIDQFEITPKIDIRK